MNQAFTTDDLIAAGYTEKEINALSQRLALTIFRNWKHTAEDYEQAQGIMTGTVERDRSWAPRFGTISAKFFASNEAYRQDFLKWCRENRQELVNKTLQGIDSHGSR